MEWARILAYITGTVGQELLLRNEYLVAENGILKAQLQGRLRLLDAGASETWRDWPSTGPQGSRRCGDRRRTGHHSGMASRSQVRWSTSASDPGPTANRKKSRN
jgi:hypothetical protein